MNPQRQMLDGNINREILTSPIIVDIYSALVFVLNDKVEQDKIASALVNFFSSNEMYRVAMQNPTAFLPYNIMDVDALKTYPNIDSLLTHVFDFIGIKDQIPQYRRIILDQFSVQLLQSFDFDKLEKEDMVTIFKSLEFRSAITHPELFENDPDGSIIKIVIPLGGKAYDHLKKKEVARTITLVVKLKSLETGFDLILPILEKYASLVHNGYSVVFNQRQNIQYYEDEAPTHELFKSVRLKANNYLSTSGLTAPELLSFIQSQFRTTSEAGPLLSEWAVTLRTRLDSIAWLVQNLTTIYKNPNYIETGTETIQALENLLKNESAKKYIDLTKRYWIRSIYGKKLEGPHEILQKNGLPALINTLEALHSSLNEIYKLMVLTSHGTEVKITKELVSIVVLEQFKGTNAETPNMFFLVKSILRDTLRESEPEFIVYGPTGEIFDNII